VLQAAPADLGTGNNGAAIAMQQVFANNAGVPAYQTSSAAATAAGTQVITPVGGLGFVGVGTVLTVDAGLGPQENVTVSAVKTLTGTFTATFANAHAAGFTLSSAQLQTLGQFYQNVVTQVGLDSQTAITGTATQTSLTNNIDKVRQGIDGINLDEETPNLIKSQNAYQAEARPINVLDSLLSLVVTSLGHG